MSWSLLKKFYIYQKIRFPIIILALSLLPAILSTIAVVNANVSVIKITGGVIASLFYLLHIRILDEQRDFKHDNKHHTSRPVQKGIISMQELQAINTFAVITILLIALSAGFYPLFLALIMLGFSSLASKEFFMGEKLRKHFFLYNGINTIQTLIMQLFAYSFFAGKIPLTNLVLLHFIFTSLGTIIFEFVRKIKLPGKDGTGKDTYTWYLGFKNSIFIYIFLALLTTILYNQILTTLINSNPFPNISSILLFGMAFTIALIHLIKKTLQTEQLMQLSFVLTYAIYNLLIYFNPS